MSLELWESKGKVRRHENQQLSHLNGSRGFQEAQESFQEAFQRQQTDKDHHENNQ